MTAPLQGNSYYFWVLGRAALSPLFLSGSQSLVLAQQPHLSSPTWAGQVPVLCWDAQRGLGRVPGAEVRGPKVVGEGPGQISGLPGSSGTVPRGWAGRASSLAVANAWHSSGISGTVPHERGNQKYLLPREAQRVTGTYPALPDEALAGEALSHQSGAQLWLQLRCEHGAGSSAGGKALQVAEAD